MYSDETKRRVIAMFNSGKTIAEIEKQTDIRTETIRKWIDQRKRKRQCVSKNRCTVIHRLNDAGFSQREIARILKIARATVKRWLERPLESIHVSEDVTITLPGNSKARCRTCGRLVFVPCLACQLEDIAESILPETEQSTRVDREDLRPMGLSLKSPHLERYQEILRWREEHPGEEFSIGQRKHDEQPGL